MQNFHSFSAQQVLGIRSVRRGSIVQENGWPCSGWLSRCGTALMSRTSYNSAKRSYLPWISTSKVGVCNDGKGTTTPWRGVSICPQAYRRWTQAEWRRFFDVLRVRPNGPIPCGYLVLSLRGYQRFDQWLYLSYPPPKSRLHAIAEPRSFLSWLSGSNNASQTQRTVGICEPLFRNYWFDFHET